MKFTKEEQETVITYDHSKGEWNFYTSVTSHINTYMKNLLISKEKIEVLTTHDGIPTSIRFTPEKSIVNKKFLKTKQRVLSEEHKQTLLEGRNKKKKPQNDF